jgi:hypothetical protein
VDVGERDRRGRATAAQAVAGEAPPGMVQEFEKPRFAEPLRAILRRR